MNNKIRNPDSLMNCINVPGSNLYIAFGLCGLARFYCRCIGLTDTLNRSHIKGTSRCTGDFEICIHTGPGV